MTKFDLNAYLEQKAKELEDKSKFAKLEKIRNRKFDGTVYQLKRRPHVRKKAVQVLLSDAEYEYIQKLAQNKKLTMPSYIRSQFGFV